MARKTGSVGAADGAERAAKSMLVRVVQLLVSICVLTGVSVVGDGGGLLLAISAKLGGPDPRMADGELLRDRLLEWPARNREFMRTNGRSEFPLCRSRRRTGTGRATPAPE